MKIPNKLSICNIPTPIQPLEAVNPDPGWAALYIKRDDYTGFETSGNKVRKFEYHLYRAFEQRADVIITCGGQQSNHSRAAASLAARLSLGCHLVLRGSDVPPDGNYFLDILFGAEITLITPEQYANSRNEIMAEIAEEYRRQGRTPYIIPEGGSNGLGMFGYYNTYMEILAQEQEMGIRFDAICVADGTGGTYSGLYAANELNGGGKHIVGFNVYSRDGARERVLDILEEGGAIVEHPISDGNIYQNFDYLGDGYGIVYPELVDNIRKTARATGIVTDPVYTGKALLGTVSEIAKRNTMLKGNVLFIHTGGQFGIFPRRELFL